MDATDLQMDTPTASSAESQGVELKPSLRSEAVSEGSMRGRSGPLRSITAFRALTERTQMSWKYLPTDKLQHNSQGQREPKQIRDPHKRIMIIYSLFAMAILRKLLTYKLKGFHNS